MPPRRHVRRKDEDIGHAVARAEQDTGPAAGYPRFRAAVALAQLTSWLPAGRRFLIDISGPGARTAEVAVIAGHSVLRVISPGMPAPTPVMSSAGGSPPRETEAKGRLSIV